MKSQQQSQPPNPGRAKAIAATSKVMDRAYGIGIGALRKPGRKMSWSGGNKNQPK
jgi:hypothetical protein